MIVQDIPYKVHFVGVGGVGTSALAQHLAQLGRQVSGSDSVASALTDKLAKLGVKVTVGHNAQNVYGADLVVHTSAVKQDNCELAMAKKLGVPTMLREQLLGVVFDDFDCKIAVCGTHGKTTVTAMIHHVLQSLRVSHACFVGGLYHGENYCFGKNIVIAEACEYNQSFLNLHPSVTLCLNVEWDHPDCYDNKQQAQMAFSKLFNQTSDVVALPKKLAYLCNGNKVFYDDAQCDKVWAEGGKPHCIYTKNGKKFHLQLAVEGLHNLGNAFACLAVTRLLRIDEQTALNAIATFDGAQRRYTHCKSSLCNVVCDYAHHPTELSCAIATAQSCCKANVFCVFQPHTHSRTKAFWHQFATCFAGVRQVVMLPVYSAREVAQNGVQSDLLCKYAQSVGVNAVFAPTFEQAVQLLKGTITPQDTLLVLGAGDVDKILPLLQ